ncbi:hypothetical protein [Streptacidiphilus sp. EB103A]
MRGASVAVDLTALVGQRQHAGAFPGSVDDTATWSGAPPPFASRST